jgi:hypothetical protein
MEQAQLCAFGRYERFKEEGWNRLRQKKKEDRRKIFT